MINKMVLFLIRLYQMTVSPDHSWRRVWYPLGYCRFVPSCSDYSLVAIKHYGLFRGGVMSLWRLLRCHPWSEGGYDPAGSIKFSSLF